MSILDRALGDLATPQRPVRGGVLRGTLLAAAAANCVWLVRFAVPTGLPWSSTLFSELEAIGHPWAPLFQGGFLLSDALVCIAGVLACTSWARPPAHPSGLAGWAALAAFGAASLIDDAVPLNCVPGHDPHCDHRAGAVLVWPVIDQIHAMVGVLAALAVVASMAAFAHLGHLRGSRLRWSWLWLGAEVVSAVALGTCLFLDAPTGLAQTSESAVETTWLLFLADTRPLPRCADR